MNSTNKGWEDSGNSGFGWEDKEFSFDVLVAMAVRNPVRYMSLRSGDRSELQL